MVTSAADGSIQWSRDVPRQVGTVRWMPDGQSLLLYSFDTQSLWMYAPPKELTRFDGFIWSFDVAGDEKSVIVAEGSLSRDAVLIAGFR